MMKTNKNSKKYHTLFIKLFGGILALAMLGIGIGGCDSEDTSTYDITVNWNIGGIQICKAPLPESQFTQSEVVFSRVEINVYEDDSKEKKVQDAISVPCEDMQAQLTRLKRDSYFVTVDAWASYNNVELPFFHGEEDIDVPLDDDEDAITVPLVVGDGKVQVIWLFDGGYQCGVANVANVSITVNDGQPYIVPCADGQLMLEDIATGTAYTVNAQALDPNGTPVFTSQHMATADSAAFSVLPGQTYQATVIFQ